MEKATIELVRMPSNAEIIKVIYESEKGCVCDAEHKSTSGLLEHLPEGEQELCKPCAAREALNEIATLAETL